MDADEIENKHEGKLTNLAKGSLVKSPKLSVPKCSTEMELLAAVHMPEGFSEGQKRNAIASSLQALREIEPRDRLEHMLAVQIQSTHSAVLQCFVRARLFDQTPECSLRHLSEATKLQGLFLRQMEALDKHRGKGQQKVVVEHVHVEAGGQAVVGQVHTGGRTLRGSSGARPAATIAPPSVAPLPTHLEAGADRVAFRTGARTSQAPTLEAVPAAPIPSAPDPALRKQPENGAVVAAKPAHTEKSAARSAPRSRAALQIGPELSVEPIVSSPPASARPSREETGVTAPAAVTAAFPIQPLSSSNAGQSPEVSAAHPCARPSPVDAGPAARPASRTRLRLSSRRVMLDGSIKAA